MNLDGKVVLVTGAGSGIGASAIVLIRARGGVAVAIDVVGGEISFEGNDHGTWDDVIAHTVAHHGRVDGLVWHAEVSGTRRLINLDLDDFRRFTAVTVEGAFVGIQKTVAQMRLQSCPAHGSIVVVSSVMATKAVPAMAGYAGTHAALSNMARAIGVELGRKGDFIRVNVVAPTDTRSGILVSSKSEKLCYTQTSQDIAETIAFLLSDDASFMTSAVLTVDGGWSLT